MTELGIKSGLILKNSLIICGFLSNLEIEKKVGNTLFSKKDSRGSRKAEVQLFPVSPFSLQLLWTLTRTKEE
jgi:hypothetical protein